jgi:hypothetical protein
VAANALAERQQPGGQWPGWKAPGSLLEPTSDAQESVRRTLRFEKCQTRLTRSDRSRSQLDPEFEVWTLDGAGGYRFADHRLLPGESLPVAPGAEARANAVLQARREALQRLEALGDFEAAVRMHHHDYWAAALLEYASRIDAATYWRLAGEFLCDHLWPSSGFSSAWGQVFSRSIPGREQMMTAEEREDFNQLPASIEVMRGFAHDGGERAFSSTRTRAVAERFAHQAATFPGAGAPRIAHGTVGKDAVIAILLRRQENEVLAQPLGVSITRIAELGLG